MSVFDFIVIGAASFNCTKQDQAQRKKKRADDSRDWRQKTLVVKRNLPSKDSHLRCSRRPQRSFILPTMLAWIFVSRAFNVANVVWLVATAPAGCQGWQRLQRSVAVWHSGKMSLKYGGIKIDPAGCYNENKMGTSIWIFKPLLIIFCAFQFWKFSLTQSTRPHNDNALAGQGTSKQSAHSLFLVRIPCIVFSGRALLSWTNVLTMNNTRN